MVLPSAFTSSFAKVNVFKKYINVEFVPLDCVWVESNYHTELVYMTLGPMICIAIIVIIFLSLRHRLIAKNKRTGENVSRQIQKLGQRTLYAIVVFVFTIFGLVIRTIVETFSYDSRLEEEEYLAVDYSISRYELFHHRVPPPT